MFGPTPDGIAVDHTEVFEGRHFRSTDGVVFNFGATLWTLHYLRLTNQVKHIDYHSGRTFSSVVC